MSSWSHVRSYTLFKQTIMKSLLSATFLPSHVSSQVPEVLLPLHRSTQLLVTHSCSRAELFSFGSIDIPSDTHMKKHWGKKNDVESMKIFEKFIQSAKKKFQAGEMRVPPPLVGPRQAKRADKGQPGVGEKGISLPVMTV